MRKSKLPVRLLRDSAQRSSFPSLPPFFTWRGLLLATCFWATLVMVAMVSARAARAGGPPPTANLPEGFQYTAYLEVLVIPTNVELSPDGRIFVTEKRGIVKVFDHWWDPTPDIFVDLRTNVFNYWDRGMLGLALHPNFPATPYVYVFYTLDALPGEAPPKWGVPGASNDTCPTPPGPTDDGCAVSGRISRLEAQGNFAVGNEVVLVENWCQQFPSHSVGDLRFGPDGALYASGGEGASFLWVDYGQAGAPKNPCGDPPGGVGASLTPPNAEGGSLRSQDLRTPGDPVAYNGTIIRIDPITGAASPGNPLAGGGSAEDDRIIAYGLRNPYRFAFRPGTSEIFIGDVGWSDYEELNFIANPTGGVPNFGWPCYAGPGPQAAWQAAGMKICQDLYAEQSVTPPYFYYTQSENLVADEGCATGNTSMAGFAFNSGNTFPVKWGGAMFVADYSRKCIWTMLAGNDGRPDAATRAAFLTGDIGPVDLEMTAAGELVLVDIIAGSVGRISYVGGNEPPVAVISADPSSGPAPLTVQLDGYQSFDPEGAGPLTYAWDVDGDGFYDNHDGPELAHQYPSGVYEVGLEVTDVGGQKGYAGVLIQASNSPPEATISAPSNNQPWAVGDTIYFEGSGYDSQDGVLPESALEWAFSVEHCPGGCHSHPLTGFEGQGSGTIIAPDHVFPSHLKILLTATDSVGQSDTAELHYYPRSVVVQFSSEPPGIEIGAGAVSGITPFTQEMLVNGYFTVSAPAEVTVEGLLFKFVAWSDGGNPSHGANAPEEPTTLTATYVSACGDGVVDGTEECDDGNNLSADCCSGTCLLESSGTPCTADAVPCTTSTCNGAGLCTHLADDGLCDDEVACTVDSCDTLNGCSNLPVDGICNDGHACTEDSCSAEFGCVNAGDNGLCDDGVPCTNDKCDVALGCTHTADDSDCNDAVACTIDSCNAVTGCLHSVDNSGCDDGVSCTVDVCDVATGCQHTPNFAACDDGVPCTIDSCDAIAGCSNTPDHTSCDDEVDCTIDACAGAMGCIYTPDSASCDDGHACTTDSCDSFKGCEHVANSGLCDDNNVCTDDSCTLESGCVAQPNSAPCNDGDGCTLEDGCKNGICSYMAKILCDDGADCTLDTCVDGECVYEKLEVCCFSDAECLGAGEFCVLDTHQCKLDVCSECSDDLECGGADGLCIVTAHGNFCGRGCSPESPSCPAGTQCVKESEDIWQCAPAPGLCACAGDVEEVGCAAGHVQILGPCDLPIELQEDCGERGCVDGACCPLDTFESEGNCLPDAVLPEEQMEVVEDYWSLDVVEAPDSSEFVESFEVVTQGEFGQDVPDMFPQSETVAPPEIFDWLPHSEGIAYTAEGNDPEPIESFVEKGSSGSGGCNASEHPAGGIELLLLALLGLLVGVVRWQWQSN